MENAKTVFLFGRPGSGKGTQAKLLAEKFGWSIFSTGDRFKALRDEQGPLGDRIRALYDAGKLAPDWFASYLFEDTMLNLAPDAGVICEGYPRSLPQAQLCHSVLSWLERPYIVIHLAVPEEDTLNRMIERAKSEHRPDSDSEEKIRARFATYTEQTEPVLDYFRTQGTLVEVDGTPTIEAIHADLVQKFS
ncbi:MAG TPA: nucleoside monophosphate kinase [Candidatus Paceibacterota bacterium]|nr:nucleoside monophosphate kinase [Candidatus Paceibacterota bacterium]